ncbi:MAG: cytidine and deoxycytidylate deaminase zinc-binding region family protein [Micavibrio sp.]|nr:cytidine and deoxycytidylate deaminase zinc-binding region family protein [Micavibrio sp.]
MNSDPFIAMQAAVDVVNTSLHATNKVAATLFTKDYTISKTNFWPGVIEQAFGHDIDIGSSSGTVHAEVACILAASMTEGASLCVTDPFCPNCAKNIAEAGIKTIYIDHKGFDKDFAARRGDHFKNMSLQVCARAGIAIYQLNRKEKTITPIAEISDDYKPFNDAPVVVGTVASASRAYFLDVISDSRANLAGEKFATALAFDASGKVFSLCAKPHLAVGYSRCIEAPEFQDLTGKYNFILEPVNRLLMNAARLGLKIHAEYLYSSIVPTSRELVNVVGAGLNKLHLGDANSARDPEALSAITQLNNANILTIVTV